MATRSRQSFNEINITPLTDIFLVLLIIMMVIAPLLDQQGLNLSVPEYVEATDVKDSKLIRILVDNNDRYFLNDVEISPAMLESDIKSKIADLPDGLLIEAGENSTHGAVVKLMDSARNVGVTNISVTQE